MTDLMFQRYSGTQLYIPASVIEAVQNHVFALVERYQATPDYLSVSHVVSTIRETVCPYFPTKRCDAERLLEHCGFKCIEGKRQYTTIVTI